MNSMWVRFKGKQWRWRVGTAMLAGCLLAGVAHAGQRRPVTEPEPPEPPDRTCIDAGSGTVPCERRPQVVTSASLSRIEAGVVVDDGGRRGSLHRDGGVRRSRPAGPSRLT